MEKMLDLYTDYLISSTGQTSATGLSTLLDHQLSHDSVTRFLGKTEFDSKTLWRAVKPLVRQHESVDACLIFDDCVIEKAYTDENDLICWHWDHSKGRNVKGINLLSAFYVSSKDEDSEPIRIPVMYELVLKTIIYYNEKKKKNCRKSAITKNEMMQSMVSQCIHNQLIFKYILADSWFASTDNMHFIQQKKKLFIFEIQDNRLCVLADASKTEAHDKPNKKSQWINIHSLQIADNTPTLVWFKDMDFPVLVTKQVFKNEENKQVGVRFLVSNDRSLSHDDFARLYKKRWSVEEYHKSLKQNVGIAKSPTRTLKTQSNHIYASIWAYIKLEKLKLSSKWNHFEIKAKIYIKALKAAFQELTAIKAKVGAA